MSYTKQEWVDYTTPVDAEHMSHIEDGIFLYGIPSGTSIPSGEESGQWFFLTQDVDTVSAGLYQYNGSSWDLRLKLNEGIIINSESTQTVEGYVVPALTDEQLTTAYNGIVAGKKVIIVDSLETIFISVIDASNIAGLSIRVMFTDKLILTYKEGGVIVASKILDVVNDTTLFELTYTNGETSLEKTIKGE